MTTNRAPIRLNVDIGQMTAALSQWGLQPLNWNPELSNARDSGVGRFKPGAPEVLRDISEVRENDGLLEVDGQHVVLYIKDHLRRPEVERDPWAGNRIHLFDCSTLRTMRDQNRIDRYVVINRPNGPVPVDILHDDGRSEREIHVPLCVCINCLKEWDYQGAEEMSRAMRRKMSQEFDFDEFFSDHETFFIDLPKGRANDQKGSGYRREWSKVSKANREAKKWICEECGVNLQKFHKLLDSHHKNGVKYDNRRENLAALCKICHQKQDGHHRMPVLEDDRRTILRLRQSQMTG